MRDCAHQPDLRGLVGDHAPVHRARGGGPPLQDRVRARRQGIVEEREGRGARRASMQFYPTWYPARWLGKGQVPGAFARVRQARRPHALRRAHTRKLGRAIFHAMVRLGPKLERRQLVLFRAVDIGAELFAMAAACVRARMLAQAGESRGGDAGRPVLPRGARAHRAVCSRILRRLRRRDVPGRAAGDARRARVARDRASSIRSKTSARVPRGPHADGRTAGLTRRCAATARPADGAHSRPRLNARQPTREQWRSSPSDSHYSGRAGLPMTAMRRETPPSGSASGTSRDRLCTSA